MSNVPQQILKLDNLFRIAEWRERIEWKPFRAGVDIYRLYGEEFGPRAALLQFHPGGHVPLHEHTGYEHIFVLDGFQSDESSESGPGALIINPPGTRHSVFSKAGCIVLAIYEKPVRFIGNWTPIV